MVGNRLLLRNNKILNLISIASILIFLIISENQVTSQENNNATTITNSKHLEILPSCSKFMMKMAKKQIKLFGECSKEMKEIITDHNEFGDKIQCVVKCVLDKGGMLNSEKKVTKSTMQDFMDKNVPELFHAISHELLEHCIEEFGPKMDHQEEFCTAYGDYVKCIQEIVADVCVV